MYGVSWLMLKFTCIVQPWRHAGVWLHLANVKSLLASTKGPKRSHLSTQHTLSVQFEGTAGCGPRQPARRLAG